MRIRNSAPGPIRANHLASAPTSKHHHRFRIIPSQWTKLGPISPGRTGEFARRLAGLESNCSSIWAQSFSRSPTSSRRTGGAAARRLASSPARQLASWSLAAAPRQTERFARLWKLPGRSRRALAMRHSRFGAAAGRNRDRSVRKAPRLIRAPIFVGAALGLARAINIAPRGLGRSRASRRALLAAASGPR